MIEDEKTGLLVRPRDEKALEKGILRLLDDPGLCRMLGENARQKAEAEFSMEYHIERLLEIYEAVGGAKNGGWTGS